MPIYIGKDLVDIDLGNQNTEVILGSYCPECFQYQLRRTGASGNVNYRDCYSGEVRTVSVTSAVNRVVSSRTLPVVTSGGIAVDFEGITLNPCYPGRQYPGLGVNCQNITITGNASRLNIVGYVACNPEGESETTIQQLSTNQVINPCIVSGSLTPSGASFVVNSAC
jgi:hypothetical protein